MKLDSSRIKDLLGLEYLTRTQIEEIVDQSTRARPSFELAAKRLSGDTLSIASSTSCVQKGESLIDTAKTLEAMKVVFLVLRHYSSGAPHLVAREIKTRVINAGDG